MTMKAAGTCGTPDLSDCARFRLPRTEEMLRRPRLEALLRRHAEHGAAWIQAGAGTGKSILAAQVATSSGEPILWLRLDETHDSAEALLALLDAAAGFSPAHALAGGAFHTGSPRQRVRAFYDRLPRSAWLVLDDVMCTAKSVSVAHLLRHLVEERPQGVRLLFLSRYGPPAVLSREIAARDCLLFPAALLAFTPEEAYAVANAAGLSDAGVVQTLWTESMGWPAAFSLMVASIRSRCQAATDIVAEARRAVFDYLDTEIFAALSHAERDALVRIGTAGEDTVDPAQCAAAFEAISGWDALVDQGWQRAPDPCGDDARVVPRHRLRPLLRSFLLSRRKPDDAALPGPAAEPGPGAIGSQAPGKLQVRVLGGLEILVNGQPLEHGRKAPARLLELTKLLLAMGGRAVPVGTLTDAIWPDASGDAAVRSFTTALHRLRRWLGSDAFLHMRDGTLSLDARHCDVDLWRLEAVLERIELGRCGEPTGNSERIEQCLAELLAAYAGPFLGHDLSRPEYGAARERLAQRFQRYLVRLCDALEAAGRAGAVIDAYERALRLMPESMAIRARLEACHAQRSGDPMHSVVVPLHAGTSRTVSGPGTRAATLREDTHHLM